MLPAMSETFMGLYLQMHGRFFVNNLNRLLNEAESYLASSLSPVSNITPNEYAKTIGELLERMYF